MTEIPLRSAISGQPLSFVFLPQVVVLVGTRDITSWLSTGILGLYYPLRLYPCSISAVASNNTKFKVKLHILSWKPAEEGGSLVGVHNNNA